MFEGINYFLKSLVKKPFKIGIISPQYPEEGKGTNKGVAIHVENISRELAKLGCEVHVFTIGKKNFAKTEYLKEGKRVIHRINIKFNVPIKEPVMERIFSKSIFDTQIVSKILKENSDSPFDILHSHTTISSGLIAKHLIDSKWIHTLHVLNKNRIKLMSKEEKKYYDLTKWIENVIVYSDALISVSEKIKEEILESYKVQEDKIFTIYNAVDLETFESESIPTKDKKILYVGRFSLEKGIDILPKIMKEVFKKDKEVKFEIVASDKSIPDSLKKTVKELELIKEKYPNRLIWHKEELNKKELTKLYNESTIYIQPSRYDSFPTTVLEAMACGKPIIVSAKGGMPEMIENAGSIVPFENEQFVKEILNLLENYKLRERYGRRAKERAKIFNWEDAAKKTLILYKKISGKLKKGEDKYGISKS
jgi:glycosyltransferase involved in cell wall biosynthesis